ncbi:hypothetical protein PsorP6_017328 [Peronosclerospora sorghi]|uniref:Uncharacterized protein n=1 Tax=Peronosclerospora sorghi TaxID=230839 RepID=A0ACC0WLE8_9STRA|nr:hypothetical protein PsorP6_017328 [Peronosclerospora sorghi]
MNRGRNCRNDCFLVPTSSTRSKDVSCATIDATRILCARAYFICAGNFCEMAKILGNTSCAAVDEICAHFQIKDCCLPKFFYAFRKLDDQLRKRTATLLKGVKFPPLYRRRALFRADKSTEFIGTRARDLDNYINVLTLKPQFVAFFM